MQDSIPPSINESSQKIIERELFDTILIFDPETYTETVKVVKSVWRDTFEILSSRGDQINDSPVLKGSGSDEIFKVVDKMPRFPGCEDLDETEQEKDQCAREKMLQFIYHNLRYPHIAKTNGVEGRVVIQFDVQKNGLINNIKIVRDIGAACGDAAIEVVEKMNHMADKWIPGTQRGQKVNVQFTLPIQFSLDKPKDK